ncbi:MAG: ABC transporter permease [Nocardioidaceae bacterium]
MPDSEAVVGRPVPRLDADETRLHELGYEQDLKRGLRAFDNVAMGFAAISPVVALYGVVGVGMVLGGPAWVWVLPLSAWTLFMTGPTSSTSTAASSPMAAPQQHTRVAQSGVARVWCAGGGRLFFSAFARTEFQAVQFLPAFILPQLLLCGLLAPRDAMAKPLELLSSLAPLTYAYDALDQVTRGQTGAGLVGSTLAVAGFAALALVLGALTLRRRTA